MSPTPPELHQRYVEIQQASEDLIRRLNAYRKLVPARHGEMAAVDEILPFVTLVERQFRGWYEECRNLRELLDDPNLRAPSWPQRPDPDPRDED